MILADSGYVAECGTILRTVSDFATEAISVCEGCIKGANQAQTDLVQQYFAPMSANSEEHAERKGKPYVPRDKLLATLYRQAEQMDVDVDRLRNQLRFVTHVQDKYLHGGYLTAMEMYNGSTHTFMLRGHQSEDTKRLHKFMIASQLYKVILALTYMAKVANMPALIADIVQAARKLYDSGEVPGDQSSN